MQVTPFQLEQILLNVKGHTFVEVEYITEVKMKKKGNINFIDYPVFKHCKVNISFNGRYQNSVNNRLDKKDIERTFVSEPLPWGEWKEFPKIISYKENTYVRFYIHKNSSFDVKYEYRGRIVEGKHSNELYQFLPPSQVIESLRQYEAGLEQEEQCKPLNINILNIKKITLNKEVYELG